MVQRRRGVVQEALLVLGITAHVRGRSLDGAEADGLSDQQVEIVGPCP